MKLLVTGMKRCGSTMLYNLLRLLFITENKSVKGFFFDDKNFIETGNPSDISIMKRHEVFDQSVFDWSDKIFAPIRDMRDIVASDLRNGLPRNLKEIEWYCQFNMRTFNSWKDHADLICIYEDYASNPASYIRSVADTVGIKLTIAEAQEVHKNLVEYCTDEISKSTVWAPDREPRESLLYSNQITAGGVVGSYTSYLKEEEIKLIENVCKDFLLENNYKLSM